MGLLSLDLKTDLIHVTKDEDIIMKIMETHIRGGGIGLLIAGLFIILIGLAAFAGFTAFWNYFWPIVIILVGVWILVLGLRRNRRHDQTTSS